jgi:2-haloacid dehalogenase
MRLNEDLKKKNINPLLVDQWFVNILKEGFASSTPENFLSFTKIAKEELKKLILLKKKNLQILEFLFSGFKNLKANSDIGDSFKILRKQNIKIVTLTNGPKKNCINLLKKNNLLKLVDYQFSVEDIKVWKPHPEPYLFVASELNYHPSEIVMIAVHGWDINGAKKVGMKTGYIKKYEKKLSSYYIKADFEAENCKELVLKIIT